MSKVGLKKVEQKSLDGMIMTGEAIRIEIENGSLRDELKKMGLYKCINIKDIHSKIRKFATMRLLTAELPFLEDSKKVEMYLNNTQLHAKIELKVALLFDAIKYLEDLGIRFVEFK